MVRRAHIVLIATICMLCFSQGVLAQGCGTTIYDTGGPNGNYTNNQNLTWTYCPPADQAMTITFTAFSVEAGWDFLRIYNGPNISSPLVGTYSGTGLPPSFTGPAGGCITLWFTSDGSVTAPGWAANLTCGPPPPPPAGDCVYVLSLNDSWGDGWGSSFVGVSINGGPYQNHTVTGSTNQVVFGVNIGDLVTLNYNNSGTWQSENSYTLSIQGGGGALFSSGTPPQAGIVYSQTVDCNPPPAPQQDCVGGHTICNAQSFNNTSNNTGNVVDLTPANRGCLTSGEQQGTWYYFSPSSTGSIGFTIAPNGALDYDFAVWGPMNQITCPPSGPPIRCSYASGFSTFNQTGSYNTGLGNGAIDLSEGAAGNGWVAPLNVTAGQIYILYIDNFSSNGQSFNLTWQLSNNASLDCTPLPVELIAFEAWANGSQVELSWVTASEFNSDHFVIERSRDGQDFHRIGMENAVGESSSLSVYRFTDHIPFHGINYYRLQQVDLDGSMHTGPIAQAEIGARSDLAYPNPTDGLLFVPFSSITEGRAFYRVHDMTGRVLLQGDHAAISGNDQFIIDLSPLSRGNYSIELVLPDGQRTVIAPVIRK